MGLSAVERRVLDFERAWWTLGEPKRDAIRARLQMSPSRYYALLDRLADSPDALAYDPLVVRRARRRRAARRARLFGEAPRRSEPR
ncbi:MAG TPA: DUF3263 domain-containing protein [Acidimicrobiales bacterium]|jgi:hypothetical protein|nr:DUF3263 domain-containing protein [Acidimicrobiales bacterium]